MSQISPPIRILLAACLAFMAAWFVFLRPGAEPVAPTPAPAPASGLGNAVQSAKDTAATSNAAADPAAAAAPGATAVNGATPVAAAASAAKKDDGGLALPPSVAKAIKQKKTLVMLFWNKKAIDDRAVRKELRGINRLNGEVAVHVASIKDVARYASITRGVNMEQSPTVIVAKGDSADALVGYVDKGAINQTVSDVIRSTRGAGSSEAPEDPYLAAVHNKCLSNENEILAAFEGVTDMAGFYATLDHIVARSAAAEARIVKLKAPKKHSDFKRDYDAATRKANALLRAAVAQIKATKDPAQIKAVLVKLGSDAKKLIAPLKAKYSDLGMDACFE